MENSSSRSHQRLMSGRNNKSSVQRHQKNKSSILSNLQSNGHNHHQNIPPQPQINQSQMKNEDLNVQDQYIKNIKYGISSIDTNLALKKFIVKQSEKKTVFTDQTVKDIKHFIDNYCRTKNEESKGFEEMPEKDSKLNSKKQTAHKKRGDEKF